MDAVQAWLLAHPYLAFGTLALGWIVFAIGDRAHHRHVRMQHHAEREAKRHLSAAEWDAMADRTAGILAPKPPKPSAASPAPCGPVYDGIHDMDTLILSGHPVDDVAWIKAQFEKRGTSHARLEPICPKCKAAIGAWGLCDCDADGKMLPGGML